jgi:hypothetical protein
VKVPGRVSVGRVVAASDVAAQPAEAKVNPFSAHFQAFLASASARRHLPYEAHV